MANTLRASLRVCHMVDGQSAPRPVDGHTNTVNSCGDEHKLKSI